MKVVAKAEEEEPLAEKLKLVRRIKKAAEGASLKFIRTEKRDRGGVFVSDGQRYSYMVTADPLGGSMADARDNLEESSVPKEYHDEIMEVIKKCRRTIDHLHVQKL